MYKEIIKGGLIALVIVLISREHIQLYEIISIAIISLILISTIRSSFLLYSNRKFKKNQSNEFRLLENSNQKSLQIPTPKIKKTNQINQTDQTDRTDQTGQNQHKTILIKKKDKNQDKKKVKFDDCVDKINLSGSTHKELMK